VDSIKYKNEVAEAKILYKSIGCVYCPAFNNEKIYFNRKGFQHLLYKKGDRRRKNDQIERLSLLGLAVNVLQESRKFTEYRTRENIKFWSFRRETSKGIITVVVAKINDGPKYFLSVMTKSTKTP